MIKPSAMRVFVAACALTFVCVFTVSAQDELTPPKAEVKATVGAAIFSEADVHSVVGGSVRYYVSRRWSIEPEFLYLYESSADRDFIFQPNVAVDLRPPTKKVVPYLIGGVGVLHHRSTFSGFDFTTGAPRTFNLTSTSWTASGGGGVKIFVSDRLFIAPEARAGFELGFRATVSVGYVFSGRRR